MEDNDPQARDMDPSCPAALQGRHRLERGRRYYQYLGHRFGPDAYASKFIALVPGVGHDGAGMFASEEGRAIIIFDADGAATAMEGGPGEVRP